MTNSISQRLQIVQAELVEAEEQLKSFNGELEGVNQQLEELSGERQQFQLLDDICSSLDKLEEMGAANLFWGEQGASEAEQQKLEHARGLAGEFQKKIGAIDERKQTLEQQIDSQSLKIEDLHEDIAEIEEQVERAKNDYIIERDERDLPYRPAQMPWTKQGDDERRFRKVLLAVFLFVLTLSGLIRFWELPEPDEEEKVEIPKHLVEIVKKRKPKPKPPQPKKQDEKKKDEKKDEKKKDQQQPKKQPTPQETQQARETASKTGALAFADDFNQLLEDDVESSLGSSASLTNSGSRANNDASRSILTSQAQGSSGGINTASLSRGIGGGGGNRMGSNGVSFERVESAIGTDSVAEDDPLTAGDGPSRSNQEIQIVFDRYKQTLYRIYQRELRNDPTLKGQIVVDITIEPDGSVSKVKLVSSDMGSPGLEKKILARVKSFNFGPKEGVPPTNIRFPLDFLPVN